MTRSTPANFSSHDEWLAHVRSEIPVEKQPYALAFGRTELFRSFYQMHGLPFPTEFAEELKRIETLQDPERTVVLELLNHMIFRGLTRHLFNRIQPNSPKASSLSPSFPREKLEELLSHLAQNNRYFAFWAAYKKGLSHNSVAEDWDDPLLHKLGNQSEEEIAFTNAMAELDKLINVFLDENRDLPSLAFERIWFLHYLRAPERMAQTRAVLGMLTAELAPCTSA
jgi:hypothetical protein